jgi:hypothetical protein
MIHVTLLLTSQTKSYYSLRPIQTLTQTSRTHFIFQVNYWRQELKSVDAVIKTLWRLYEAYRT